jgi:hypothetical protein
VEWTRVQRAACLRFHVIGRGLQYPFPLTLLDDRLLLMDSVHPLLLEDGTRACDAQQLPETHAAMCPESTTCVPAKRK